MSNRYALSTIDNPFNPFEDFIQWYLYDIEKGYNSCGRLARVANLTDDLSEIEEDKVIEKAIDDIIKYDITDKYIKVSPNN